MELGGFDASGSADKGQQNVPNGKAGDNPLSDLTIHGAHCFAPEVEEMLLEIDRVGRRAGRWPLGENWPFSPREFDWAQGKDLDTARRLLTHLLTMLKAGRGDEVLVDPSTGKPFIHK
ncbi:MAG: hypothetical protein KY459_05025 [Acidobacteria bacterium]|nr:hypothetical protein [Acidobacteriota bacterium]